jgi:hypothetical protein
MIFGLKKFGDISRRLGPAVGVCVGKVEYPEF